MLNEIDILLHAELQTAQQLRDDIDRSLDDITNIIDTFEIYKTNASLNGTKFSEYLQKKEDRSIAPETGPSSGDTPLPGIAVPRRKNNFAVPLTTTPVVRNMSYLLNNFSRRQATGITYTDDSD